jgi:hypothetical protein
LIGRFRSDLGSNPTGMILSAAMMLDWLADKHGIMSRSPRTQRTMPLFGTKKL